MGNKKTGFTLAEILITLGIIGIAAVMTMMNLIAKYKMKTYEIAFKKQYSVLQNAINFVMRNDGLNTCYVCYPKGTTVYQMNHTDCKTLYTGIVSSLNLKKVEDASNIKSKYALKSDVETAGGSFINSRCSYDYMLQLGSLYTTNDSAYIIMDTTSKLWPAVIIDVNGSSGPNLWEYDVFFMMLTSHNKYETDTIVSC